MPEETMNDKAAEVAEWLDTSSRRLEAELLRVISRFESDFSMQVVNVSVRRIPYQICGLSGERSELAGIHVDLQLTPPKGA